MKRVFFAGIALLALAGVTGAQAPKMPQPSAEVKRLEYFVGTWKADYEIKPGPMGPGGKMSTVDQSRFMPAGFFSRLARKAAARSECSRAYR